MNLAKRLARLESKTTDPLERWVEIIADGPGDFERQLAERTAAGEITPDTNIIHTAIIDPRTGLRC